MKQLTFLFVALISASFAFAQTSNDGAALKKIENVQVASENAPLQKAQPTKNVTAVNEAGVSSENPGAQRASVSEVKSLPVSQNSENVSKSAVSEDGTPTTEVKKCSSAEKKNCAKTCASKKAEATSEDQAPQN